MKTIGKFISNGGLIIGTIAEYNIKITGQIVGTALDIANKNEYAKKSRKLSKNVGELVGNTTAILADLTGVVLDKTIDVGINTVKYIGKNAIKTRVIQYGNQRAEDEERFINAHYEIIK